MKISVSHELSPYKLLVREALEIPKIVQTIAIALNSLPKINGKTLLLKTAVTLDVGHREINPSFPFR